MCDAHGIARLALMLADDAPCHIPLILTHRAAEEAALDLPAPTHGPATWPSVSIIVATRDRPELLEACLAGLSRLDYGGPIDWIIVDNGSTDPRAMALLDRYAQESHVSLLRRPGPFNFSALNNAAALAASGQFLLLLNNDVEPLDGQWLSRMMIHAMRPDSGAVGCLLLYPDQTVQHAGVVIGMGGAAGHVQKGVRLTDARWASWFRTTRQVSAVTAACLLVQKDKFMAVDGLDETAFPVAFNDVDLCLKLNAAGWRNIMVAEARLIHHESKSHFSPLFSLSSERCTLVL